jgi:hypothetical protein
VEEETESGTNTGGTGGIALDWRIIPGTWKSASTADHLIFPTYEYDDGNNGHGNDTDGVDESNPGNS